MVAVTRTEEGVGVRMYRSQDLSQGITTEVLAECETEAGSASHQAIAARETLDGSGLVVALDNGVAVLRDRGGRDVGVSTLPRRIGNLVRTVGKALESGGLSTVDSAVWLLQSAVTADGQPTMRAERRIVRHPVAEGPERVAGQIARQTGAVAVIAEFGATSNGESAAMAEGLAQILSSIAPPQKDLRALLRQSLQVLHDVMAGVPAQDLDLERLPDMLAAVDNGIDDVRKDLCCPAFEAHAPQFFGAKSGKRWGPGISAGTSP